MYKQNITTIAELVNTIARLRLSVTLIGFVLHQNANICLVFMFWPESLHLLQVHTLVFQHACKVALLRDKKKTDFFVCVQVVISFILFWIWLDSTAGNPLKQDIGTTDILTLS